MIRFEDKTPKTLEDVFTLSSQLETTIPLPTVEVKVITVRTDRPPLNLYS